MRFSLTTLVAAIFLCGTFAFAQQPGPRAGGPMFFGGNAPEPLFGANLEKGDFPEGVWYLDDEG
ncbi:MAG: hypothetical protein ACI4QC_03315, partial [Thermoguttaceae bacterium]